MHPAQRQKTGSRYVKLFERHYTSGDKFPRDRFFPIGNRTLTNSAGGTIVVKAYDYGLPNTPENRKTLTNGPAVK